MCSRATNKKTKTWRHKNLCVNNKLRFVPCRSRSPVRFSSLSTDCSKYRRQLDPYSSVYKRFLGQAQRRRSEPVPHCHVIDYFVSHSRQTYRYVIRCIVYMIYLNVFPIIFSEKFASYRYITSYDISNLPIRILPRGN